MGFGKSTKTFPGEAKGLIKKSRRPIDIAYASIGQNWTATPIQVAMAYSAIANGGYLLKPNFVKEIVNPQTGERIKIKKKVIGKVLSDRSLKKQRYPKTCC
ncbi:MAG: penicillin-binding transpeptidase domain-containing protein [Persephonella sp.]|nr:penicillin-binding transpeptidase domain-containing protein [Persephonella sp.]